MKASRKRLIAVLLGAVVLPAAALAGFFFWQVYDLQSGPRTIAPDVLVPEYTGPGSLHDKRANPPPGEE